MTHQTPPNCSLLSGLTFISTLSLLITCGVGTRPFDESATLDAETETENAIWRLLEAEMDANKQAFPVLGASDDGAVEEKSPAGLHQADSEGGSAVEKRMKLVGLPWAASGARDRLAGSGVSPMAVAAPDAHGVKVAARRYNYCMLSCQLRMFNVCRQCLRKA